MALPKLFSPIKIAHVEIKNRIAMAPMGTLWPGFVEPDGSLTQRVIDYYVERAAGGCGLIITGINRSTDLEKIPCPLVSPETQSSFSELAEQVHYYGTNPNLLGGETHVTVTVTKYAGTDKQETRRYNAVLEKHDDVAEICHVEF